MRGESEQERRPHMKCSAAFKVHSQTSRALEEPGFCVSLGLSAHLRIVFSFSCEADIKQVKAGEHWPVTVKNEFSH